MYVHYAAESVHRNTGKHALDDRAVCTNSSVFTKWAVIEKILSYGILTDDEIDQYVNDYIYGDRVTFTLWNFQQ